MALPGTDKGNQRHLTKGTRQIPQATAELLSLCRSDVGGEEGDGELGEGKPTGGAGKQYEKEIAGENHILAPPRMAFTSF